MTIDLRVGDCLDVLRTLDAQSVQTCVTSPPYFGLRDYGVVGQIGLEATPDAYVAKLVDVFREVRRVLRDDGTLWLNLGDSYNSAPVGRFNGGGFRDSSAQSGGRDLSGVETSGALNKLAASGLPAKNLLGIPWRVAFALQADGWWLRSDIVWAKPNGMPESVQDRPTRSHEMVFLLSKSERYFYDAAAARTPPAPTTETRLVEPDANGSTLTGAPHGRHVLGAAIPEKERRSDKQRGHGRVHAGFNDRWDAMEKAEQMAGGSNLRTVWWLAPAQFREGHFATMPTALAEICVTAGSRVGDTILDPFGGAGTTGLVADRLSRNALLIELNPEYAELARKRITDDCPLFTEVSRGSA